MKFRGGSIISQFLLVFIFYVVGGGKKENVAVAESTGIRTTNMKGLRSDSSNNAVILEGKAGSDKNSASGISAIDVQDGLHMNDDGKDEPLHRTLKKKKRPKKLKKPRKTKPKTKKKKKTMMNKKKTKKMKPNKKNKKTKNKAKKKKIVSATKNDSSAEMNIGAFLQAVADPGFD